MRFRSRNGLIALLALLLIAATAWAFSFPRVPPADFTFINENEITSVDPAMVIGQSEMRVIIGLFEGLVNWDPKTLAPIPGVADKWEISPDQLTYTMHLRSDARWTDDTPVTAHDFLWEWRRALDPLTADEYSYQLWYLENAERYSERDLNPGDKVEIELHERAPDSLPFARGKMLRGKLLAVQKDDKPDGKVPPIYEVEIDGQRQLFQMVLTRDLAKWSPPAKSSVESCKSVLLDFDEVGAKALDDHTLQLKLKSPTPYFLFLLGYFPLFPTNPKCLETYGYPDWVKPEHIVCNGAYKLETHKVRDRIRLVKNEKYWDAEHVRLNSIDILPVESMATELNLYMTGQVDWIPKVPATVVPELLANKRTDFHPTPEMTIYFYRINCTTGPTKDPRVRKALALAVNKKDIVEGVTRGGEIPALSMVPLGLPGYEPAQGEPYNPELARKLLTEAGYPGGQGLPKIEILYNTEEAHQSVAELIQAQWKENLGIDAGLQNMEWNAYLAAQQKLQYQVSRSGWIGDYLDPNTFLDMWTTDNPNNQTGWSNKEYDKLIAQAATESVPEKRMQILKRAEAILLDELPIIPIYYRISTNMVRPYVKGWYPNLLDTHPLNTIWIDEEEKQRFIKAGGRG
jgi:oligopeptide transport system substrate-binding protein